jgi:hypothetical protein
MENASKALIIAGAILISILLISVGVLVMNSINPMKDSAQKRSESMASESFNAQFTSYEGEQSGSQVRAMFSAVNASNAANPDHQVKVVKDDGTTEIKNASGYATNKKYTIEIITYDAGYASVIQVKQ